VAAGTRKERVLTLMQLSSRLRLVAGVAAAVVVVQGAGIALSGSAAAATAKPTKTALATVHPTAGKAATLTATVTPHPSAGTVAFADAGKTLTGCSKAAVKSGEATCKVTFKTAGRHAVTAKYSGKSGAYAASTAKATVTVAVAAPRAITLVGTTGSCTTSTGALVAVDFAHWSGPVVRGCGTTLTTARGLLTSGGFTSTDVTRFPGFLCRLGNPLYAGGTQYPTPAQDACVVTPPASAYWSFWTAAKGVNTWTYSPHGADADKPVNGEVEAWTFGSTDVNGTTGQPTFTPTQVRAGLPASTAVAARRLTVSAAKSTASPDIADGTGYLVDHLVGGTHYAPYGFTDLGLTIDGALSLAAAQRHEDVLADIVDYVAAHQSDYTGLSASDSQYASGGSVGKVAELAETVGRDPRSFAGVDLIKGLDDATCTKTDPTTQCAAKGGYAFTGSVFAQSVAIIGQLRASDTAGAQSPITFLESLQRSSGGFPSALDSVSPADTDSTAIAAMALALVRGSKARAAVARALHWLAGQQVSDGGFPGAAGDSVNSAALAVQALHLDAERYHAAIAQAEAFLAAAQNTDGGFDMAAGVDGSDLRASTQAVSGALGIPFGSILDDLGAKNDASNGADYLHDQLIDGNHYEGSYNGSPYVDQGLTADGLFALLTAGSHAADVQAMTTWLAGQVGAYADPTGSDPGGDGYGPLSGALAKEALVAESTGGNPHGFGGTDLLAVLHQHVCASADPAGDTSGRCTATGDFAFAYSEISQALGVLALQASPVTGDHLTASSPEVVRLHQLQCADGGFSSSLIAPGAACTSEVDATGYAVQALAAVPGTDRWLGSAQHYLVNAQKSGGLYSGAAGDNSNSTALAAQGLQTLVTALYSRTPDAAGAKPVPPITTWQSALRGLRSLAVSGGGFGLTDTSAADLRASTQAVAATAQGTLIALSGAPIESEPRDAADSTGGSGSGNGSGSSGSGSAAGGSSSSSPAGAAGSGGPVENGLADTGVTAGSQLVLAMLLLLAGAGLVFAGRRRIVALNGRHRQR
jgi:LPXTG-motif cell wall-anchored protein